MTVKYKKTDLSTLQLVFLTKECFYVVLFNACQSEDLM